MKSLLKKKSKPKTTEKRNPLPKQTKRPENEEWNHPDPKQKSKDGLTWLSIVIRLHRSLLLEGLFDGIQYTHRINEFSTLLFGQRKRVYSWEPTEELCLWVRPCFSISARHVSFVLLGWFVWWEISGHSAAFVGGVAFRICSKHHTASLYSCIFSPSTLVKSKCATLQ